MSGPSVRAGLAIAAVCAGTFAVPAHAAGCKAVRRTGGWTAVEVPPSTTFPSVDGAYLEFYPIADRVAGDPVGGGRMYFATNRTTYRTVDGGCSWRVVLDLDTAGEQTSPWRQDPGYQVVQLATAASRYVYALVLDPNSALTAPLPAYLAVSTDGGGTWQVVDPGPAPALAGGGPQCTAARIFVAPDDPKTVYLDCYSNSLGTFYVSYLLSTGLFVTADSGHTWRKAARTGYPPIVGVLPALAIDPADSRRLWIIWGDELSTPDIFHSADGGGTWKSVWRGSGAGRHMVSAAAVRQKGRPVRVMLATTAGMVESVDGGRTWRTIRPMMPGGQEGPIQWVAYERGAASLFMVSAYNVGYSGTEEVFNTCNQGERIARYDLARRKWQGLPKPASSPRNTVFQLRSPAGWKGANAMLMTAYPSQKDCQSGKKPRNYLMTYPDGGR